MCLSLMAPLGGDVRVSVPVADSLRDTGLVPLAGRPGPGSTSREPLRDTEALRAWGLEDADWATSRCLAGRWVCRSVPVIHWDARRATKLVLTAYEGVSHARRVSKRDRAPSPSRAPASQALVPDPGAVQGHSCERARLCPGRYPRRQGSAAKGWKVVPRAL